MNSVMVIKHQDVRHSDDSLLNSTYHMGLRTIENTPIGILGLFSQGAERRMERGSKGKVHILGHILGRHSILDLALNLWFSKHYRVKAKRLKTQWAQVTSHHMAGLLNLLGQLAS